MHIYLKRKLRTYHEEPHLGTIDFGTRKARRNNKYEENKSAQF